MKLVQRKEILIGLILLIAVAIVLVHFLETRYSLNDFREYVNSFGPWVPVVLLLIIIITSSIGFIFTIPVAISALVFDVYEAFIISIIGLTIGAAISFLVARYLGRSYFEKKYINKIAWLKRYDEHLKKRGYLPILFIRFITLIPFELVNIAAGLSRVKFSHYMIATFFGIMPGAIITIYFVRTTQDIYSIKFLLSSLLLTASMVLPLAIKRVREIVLDIQ